MSTLDRMAFEANEFNNTIAQLKAVSKRWPEILTVDKGLTTYLSTLVRIERDGKWYLVHCVESFHSQGATFDTEVFFIKKLAQSVHFIRHFWKVGGNVNGVPAEEEDTDQRPEDERLRETYRWLKSSGH